MSPAYNNDEAILQVHRLKAVPGAIYGLSGSSLFADLQVKDAGDSASLCRRMDRALVDSLPPERPEIRQPLSGQEPAQVAFLQTLSILIARFQEAIGIPILEGARQIPAKKGAVGSGWTKHTLILPTMLPQVAAQALQWFVLWINTVYAKTEQNALDAAQQQSLNTLLDTLAPHAPSGYNTLHFIRAAHVQGIPWIRLPSNVVQYGWGCRARLLCSSLTDATPAISTQWAKNKQATSALLRIAGLPVPEQHGVSTAQQAVERAVKMGYPVVIKPAALDQGVGVAAGLRNAEQVTQAYKQAQNFSKDILIEKHIAGQDYRLVILDGRLQYTVLRIPGGVTGDGSASIGELIAQVNQDPRRNNRRFAVMKPLTLDEEAQQLLAAAGMDSDSVPPQGVFVRLRRTANVSRGGVSIPVEGPIHEDNRQLALQAVRLLRLDVAGVDLLLPDIARSWQETGGAVCEVNAQPQIGLSYPEFFGQILSWLIPKTGRIPVGLVLADTVDRADVERLSQRWKCPVTIVTDRAAPQASRLSLRDRTRAKLIDPQVQAVAIITDGRECLSQGFPVDRFAEVVIGSWRGDDALLARVLSLGRYQLAGAVMIADDHPLRSTAVRILGAKIKGIKGVG